MVLWHGTIWKVMARNVSNDLSWQTRRPTTLQSINSMHWWPSFQRRRIETCRRIGKSTISNCSEMLVLRTYWKTWYSTVSEQTCTIDYEMDQSLWQTIISFDLLHPSYMWIQTVLSCGKHCKTMQVGTVSTLRFCEILRIQSLHQVENGAFLEVICLFQ